MDGPEPQPFAAAGTQNSVSSNRKSEIRNPKLGCRLIVNADDFGRSSSINQAVIRAHREGILTTASLMVNEPASTKRSSWPRKIPNWASACISRCCADTPRCRRKKSPAWSIRAANFPATPLAPAFAIFSIAACANRCARKSTRNLHKFHATGLPLDHVNGHLHLHLHPVVFGILMEDAEKLGIRRMRFTRDCLARSRRMARGRWFYRVSHAAIYQWLSSRAREPLRQRGIRHTQITFGLLQDSRVDEDYILKLLPELPPGDSELYSHPSLDEFKHEFDALVSPRVKEQINQTRHRIDSLPGFVA